LRERLHIAQARLLVGLAGARAVPGFAIDGEASYDEGDDAWILSVSIRIGEPSQHVPASTKWILQVASGYPYGDIHLYPANDGGLTATFQHQDPNLVSGGRWRTGKLCLDNPYRLKSIAARGNDPVGDADARLGWYATRAVEWVARAARGDLVRPEDPFEIPKTLSVGAESRCVHDESATSFGAWAGREGTWGRVGLSVLPNVERALVAARFYDQSGSLVRDTELGPGEHDRDVTGASEGIWWLWPKPIVVPPWQAPVTWNDLRLAGKEQDVDVMRTLRAIAATMRGAGPVVLLLGYPIRRTWGGPAVEIHWQAVHLGSFERGRPHNGFRPNEAGWWQRDVVSLFGGGKVMRHANSENWHPDRLQARGRISRPFSEKKVAIVGCGSLGSKVADLAIRGGVRRLLLIDGEDLEAGNLVRHLLTVNDVGKNKAAALAAMLRASAPGAVIEAYEDALPADTQDVHDLLEDYEVMIDCTASNDVPGLLASTWWSVPRWFVSASVGFEARRTFLYRAHGHTFPATDFHAELAPWLVLEEAAWAASGEVLEGAGCYSPLFRARLDDISTSAIATLRFTERAVAAASGSDEFLVLEKNGLAGLAKADLPRVPIHAAAI
jgi:hypothetical protein